MANVAINGLGRIGRAALKVILENEDLNLVAVNDLVPADNLAYLLRYDTVYGRYQKAVEAEGNKLLIDGKEYPVYSEKDPAKLPWKELEVDLVFECSGVFTKRADLEKHLKAGARKVILSAPAKEDDIRTIVYGVNAWDEQDDIISTASCTTNCVSPVMEILNRRIGVKKANMTTIHAYTSSQNLVDGPHKKARRGRAAGANFVPTTTGAAIAAAKVVPEIEGRFDGAAIRGPVPVGSIADVNLVMERETSVEEINDIFREEAESERYKGILGASDDELVSSDIIQDSRPSVVDLSMTQVVGGDLVKVMSWYDNEWGYVNQMVREAKHVLSMQHAE
ncbi:type I glyceraldehyde-3-phosphate dehydrogenase [Nafulsella turpanensis]|uniref:type I glyceraldehyde-3-phosphate dehydrogenase n=1 Tax=Nafulsella turpanensis TaxID=1265690 RepID=UPI000345D59C|nr:type I glyceraldehyde-3-phosphate dehydrogenase [Nafulsella turpanensis]